MLLPRRKLVLLATALLTAGTANSHAQIHPTATLTINGPSGVPPSGSFTVTIDGSGGYTETVGEGQYSSAASLASGLAAKFCHDYIRVGLYAKAGANNNTDPTTITFQLTNGQTFGAVSFTSNPASFGATSTGFTSANPTSTPPFITAISQSSGVVGTQITISGENLGTSGTITFGGIAATTTSWSGSPISVTVPAGAESGPIILTTSGIASNGYPFTISPIVTNLSFSPATGAQTFPALQGPPQVGFVINGTTFGANDSAPNTYVTINNIELTTLSWSDTQIIVQVPAGTALGGPYSVVVTRQNVASPTTGTPTFTVVQALDCSTP
jgi:hypothetical protein